ncbi:hypothetical protein ACI0ZE_004297, partial [Cronobacter sakazakii]
VNINDEPSSATVERVFFDNIFLSFLSGERERAPVQASFKAITCHPGAVHPAGGSEVLYVPPIN